MTNYYDIIFKRKSVRKFDPSLSFTEDELRDIKLETENLTPLDGSIKVRFEIVKRADTSAKWGEYCLLMYSERKPLYLLNAGFMLEQMDLYFASRDIGTCWYGIAKPKAKRLDGHYYVIMLAFGKSRPQDFRRNVSEFIRYGKEEIWQGDFDPDVVEAVRLAPSATNSQPWRFESSSSLIRVYRNNKTKSIITKIFLPYYNSIDMGICLCFLETVLAHKGFGFERTLFSAGSKGRELIDIAEYALR